MASRLIVSFQAHYTDLLRYLTRRTGDAERAEDLVQDTYVKLAAAEPEMLPIENERAYLYRVAGNLAIDTARRDGRQATWLSDDALGEEIVDAGPSPERVAIGRDELRRFEQVLEGLPIKPRLALLMFRVDGLSHAEIARRLGVTESMVAKYIGQTLRQCRDQLWQSEKKIR